MFLARAVLRIGPAMFGNVWTGKEVTTEFIEALPDRKSAKSNDVWRARDIIKRQQSERDWDTDPLTDADWRAARTEINADIESRRLPLTRAALVQREISERCESGDLVSAARAREGGQMMQLSKTSWNTDRWQQRFGMCQIHPKYPFVLGSTGSDHCWIFLTSESLDRFLLTKPFVRVTSENLPHLSPYIRIMLAVAKKLDITPDHQPKKDEVMAEIREVWTGQPLSKNLLEAMATMLREPESQLGRARKSPSSRSAAGAG